MKKYALLLCVFVLVFSCKEKVPNQKRTDELIMYQSSEMAQLMNAMYKKNEQIKKQILAGENIADFPKEYLKIHTASLTNAADRNPVFESFSKAYINNMKQVFVVDKQGRSEQFNAAINSCIACHQNSCTGPIPRIKKLLIP